MNTLFSAKINTAISENFPMYFVKHGLWTVELRAVSFTFENGNERTRKLETFDIRFDIEKIIRLGIELKKRLPAIIAPDLAALEGFFWDGTIEKSISAYITEFSDKDAK